MNSDEPIGSGNLIEVEDNQIEREACYCESVNRITKATQHAHLLFGSNSRILRLSTRAINTTKSMLSTRANKWIPYPEIHHHRASIVAFVAAGISRIGIDEKFLDGHFPGNQPLLMTIPNNSAEVFFVRLAETKNPGIGSQKFSLLIPLVRKPCKRDNSRVDHPLITDLLGLLESLDQTNRCPGMFVDDFLLDHRHMHDGEDAGLLKVFTLDLFVVGKQSSDPFIAADDGPRDVRIDHGWNLPLREHCIHMLSGRNHLDLQARRRREFDIFAAIDHPGYRLVRHPVMLLQNSPQPDVARRLEIRAADSFADQVLWSFDTRLDIDESKTMAKSAMEKNRNRRYRHIAGAGHEVGADVELTDIVLKISRHAPMTLSRPVAGQHDKLDAVCLNRTFLQRADDFVITASKRQPNLVCHLSLLFLILLKNNPLYSRASVIFESLSL